MFKFIFAMIMLMLSVNLSYAETGTEFVKKYLKIPESKSIDEYVVKNSLVKVAPRGATLKVIVKNLEKLGIYYNPKKGSRKICFPADNTQLLCQFMSTKESRGMESDYTAEFVFDKNNKLEDVIVVRSCYGKVKRHTTNPTPQAINIRLLNNLGVGSKISEFDSVYGKGEVDDSPDVADDWPLSILYRDASGKYFYVGVDVGNMTWADLKKVKQTRESLGELKAGIIYVIDVK